MNVCVYFFFFCLEDQSTMSKKTPGKKPGNDDIAKAAEASVAAAEASTLRSPRAERQNIWARRADDAVTAMQHVQQLLQQHTSDVDSAKQNLDQVVSTATLLWALEVEELPPQYRDKSRPSSQRVGSAASGRGSSAADRRSSSKQSQRASGANAGESNTSGEATPAAETVESVIRQLAPAQHSKISSALHALFYASVAAAAAMPAMTPAASPTVQNTVSEGGKATVAKAQLRPADGTSNAAATGATATGNGVAEGDSAVLTESVRKGPVIPAPLSSAMRELQGRRIQLEAQLIAASTAVAQQLQRFQLLQEESMVAQYALEALRGDASQP